MNRGINFLLIIFVYLYWFLRGSARKLPKKINKIAVVQSAKLGDMICTTPVFRAIKKKFPAVHVAVMGTLSNREILLQNSDVDEYILYPKSFLDMWRSLRRAKFDVACVVGPDAFSLAALYLAGVPFIVTPEMRGGVSQAEGFFYQCMRALVYSVPHYMGSYVPREYLRVLEPLGIVTEDTEKHLGFSATAEEKIDTFFEQQKITAEDFIIGISPSAGNKLKNWPVERFAEVITYILAHYKAKIVLIGNQNDRNEAEEVLTLLNGSPDVHNACEQFSIDELKAFMARISMFLAVDTGPIYIAEAFHVPTVDILGPVSEHEQPPQGPHHRNVFIPRERAAMPIMNIRMFDSKEIRRQVEEITAPMVIAVVDQLLKDLNVKTKTGTTS